MADTPRREFLRSTAGTGLAMVGVSRVVSATTRGGGDLVWTFTDPDERMRSSPTVVDVPASPGGKTVFVGNDDGTLYAVDAATGDRRWAFTDPGGPVVSSPAVAGVPAGDDSTLSGGYTVFVGSHDGSLYAVDAATGDREWTFSGVRSGTSSSPTVLDVPAREGSPGAGGYTVFTGSHDGTLHAVDAATGDRRWAFTDPDDRVTSPTVVDLPSGGESAEGAGGNTVFVGCHEGSLYAVDAATGDRKWAFTDASGEVWSSPTVADVAGLGTDDGEGYTVFVADRSGTLYAVDAATGDRQWAFTDLEDVWFSSPTVADVPGEGADDTGGRTVFVGSTDASLYAVDAATGDRRWTFSGPEFRIRSSPTVARVSGGPGAGGTVYVGSREGDHEEIEGAIHAVDAATGERKWAFTDPDDWVLSSPTVVDGVVYVGSREGTLYAVDTGTGETSVDSRVALGTLGHHHEWAGEPAERRTSSSPPGEGGPDDETESESLPGPGILGTIAGIGGVGYWLSRRSRDENPRRNR